MYPIIKDYCKHFKIKMTVRGKVDNDKTSPLREAIDRTMNEYERAVIKPEAYENAREVQARELCNLVRAGLVALYDMGIEDPEPMINALVKADIKGKKRDKFGRIIKDGFVPPDLKGLY